MARRWRVLGVMRVCGHTVRHFRDGDICLVHAFLGQQDGVDTLVSFRRGGKTTVEEPAPVPLPRCMLCDDTAIV